MTPPKTSKSVRWKAIREWIAIAVSVGAAVISFVAFKDVAAANEIAKKANERAGKAEAERRLDEAWDIFGGGKEGTTVLSSLPTETGTLERANRKIRDALLSDPQNPRAFRLQAIYFRAILQPEQAAQAIQRAIALATTDPEERARDYITQGAILSDAGNADAAIKTFRKAKNIDPTNPLVLYDLAEIYHREKRDQESNDAYNEAIRLTAKTRGFAIPVSQNIPPSQRLDLTNMVIEQTGVDDPSKHVT